MRYISTRGEAPSVSFTDALLIGLARDGGLYVPESSPQISAQTIAGFKGKAYADVAVEVISPFIGGAISNAELSRMAREAYAAFDHPAVAPLHALKSGEYLLELFHGPTLAFKDVAMQLLARLMDHVLAERGERATIVGATSGDTGGAAIEAFRGRERADVIILFPNGRVSDVQRRMMTTLPDRNVHAVAINGTFDDCQAIVKGLFADHRFRDRVKLSGVNSINWGRIVAQIVYYFTAAAALGGREKISFVVPTGNFGDIFAGYTARRMGLPMERLVIATNVNDILARTLASGCYEVKKVIATESPAMDIQVSSNFERLLFDAYGRDAAAIRALMSNLASAGSLEIAAAPLAAIRGVFDAGRADEAETRETIRAVDRENGYLLDPHSAVGIAVARKLALKRPFVSLATAHPAKFPEAVAEATGKHPALPARLADLGRRQERFEILPADQAAVAKFVMKHSRVAEGAAA
ncbi:MAG TPA: threonine synthase [Xanthobacteraceae bacterium]|nr:threonine synthase [Xanthobacteraceae bacterium]